MSQLFPFVAFLNHLYVTPVSVEQPKSQSRKSHQKVNLKISLWNEAIAKHSLVGHPQQFQAICKPVNCLPSVSALPSAVTGLLVAELDKSNQKKEVRSPATKACAKDRKENEIFQQLHVANCCAEFRSSFYARKGGMMGG